MHPKNIITPEELLLFWMTFHKSIYFIVYAKKQNLPCNLHSALLIQNKIIIVKYFIIWKHQ
jgi:hypothetical protein